MVTRHSKYRREQYAKDDKKQTVLREDGSVALREDKPRTEFTYINMDMQVMCPFCLHKDRLGAFLISTKKGYHRGMGACPECKNQMRFDSLTAEWTPEQYAEWAYPYGRHGFWDKVPWSVWKKRLYALGWSHRFWTRYKELKGEEPMEKYEDYLMRQQEEWAQEQMVGEG